MRVRFRKAAWCGGVCVTLGAPIGSVALAQNEAPFTLLETVTVQGESVLSELPVGTTVTDHHQLQQRSINDWTDFSRRGDPSVNFNRQNNSINIRGTDADRVVTRIDGVRLPWLSDGARGVEGGLNAVPFSSLSSVEIKRGAGSTQSGAISGAVDLRTLSPSDLLGPDKDLGVLLNSGYDSADHSWRADASLAGRLTPDTRWLVHVGTRHGDELRNHSGIATYGPNRIRTNPQDYQQNNILLKLDHDLSAEHALELSGESFRHKTDIDNRRAQGSDTSFEIGRNATREQINRDRVVVGYQFNSTNERSALDNGYLKTYWQRVELESAQSAWRTPDARGNIIPGDPYNYGYPHGAWGRTNRIQESGFGTTTQWNGYFNSAATQHHWTVGADWYNSRTRQAAEGYDNCPTSGSSLPAPFGPRSCDLLHTGQADMPRVKGQAWSIWAQNEMSWQNGLYALTPALRFDAYRYNPQLNGAYQQNPNAEITQLSNNSDQRFSPSLLASWQPSNTLTLYANYAYGFKAPNASQLYLNYGAPGTYLNVGNSDLKPETSRGWELGIDAGDAELRGRLSFFNNRYNNFIDSGYAVSSSDPNWDPAWNGQYPMGVTTTINRSRVQIYGAEASSYWQITPRWYGRGAIAWTRGKDLDADTYLNSVAPLKASLALGYETPRWGAETLLNASARHSKVEQSNDFKTPGYSTTDLSAWWKPSVVKGLRLQAGIYNVFDKRHWDALNVGRSGRDVAPVDYYTEPGRSFRISLSYQY